MSLEAILEGLNFYFDSNKIVNCYAMLLFLEVVF